MSTSLSWRRLNFFILASVITPLLLAVWRSIWGFLDIYLVSSPFCKKETPFYNLDECLKFNATVVFVVGLVLRLCVEVSQHEFGDILERFESGNRWWAKLVTVPATYLYIFLNILITLSLWRGLWAILDLVKENTISPAKADGFLFVIAVMSLLTLLLLRATISMIALPLGIQSDHHSAVFRATTVYDTRLTDSTYLTFVADQVMSMIVNLMVIIGWWALWELVDDVATKVNGGVELNTYYYWSSVYTGHILTGFSFFTQFPLKSLPTFRRNDFNFHYHFCHYVIVLTGVIGSLLVWRGWWNVLDLATLHLIADPEANYLVTGLAGMVCLAGAGCLHTAACRGVGVRIEHDSDDLLFDLEYRHPCSCIAPDDVLLAEEENAETTRLLQPSN